MRIGLVIENFDPRRGGAEGWTYQHAARLAARGHEVHVVSQTVDGPALQLPITGHAFGRVQSLLGRAAAAERVLKPLALDVIHDIGLGWHGQIIQSEDGSRLAQWEHNLELLPPALRPLKRLMLHVLPRYRAYRTLMRRQYGDPRRLVIAISQMCARDYIERHGVAPDRVRTIHHGTDAAYYSPEKCVPLRQPTRQQLGLRDDELTLLFVGHDFRRKGLATALRAVERLVIEGHAVRLLVVGGTHRRQRLRLTPLQQTCVTLVGRSDDPLPYYAAADILVLPSFYDPFGLVVLEGAACGLPVITTHTTGASELITAGREGFVVSHPANDDELTDRVRQLLAAELRRRMGQAARKLALQHTLDRNCDETLAVYDEIIAPRRAAA